MKHSYCRTLLLFVLFIISAHVKSQPDVAWASNITGQGYDETFDVALDTAGDVFICGQIEFTSHFGTYPLSTAGIHDIYLVKYNHSGQVLWARREGGVGGDKAYSVGTDRAGNAYIVGEYEEDFMFGTTHVVADAGNNMFIAKYDSAGTFKWVKTIQGGGETVRGYACAVDPDGNVYAGGVIHGDAEYNGTRLFSTRGKTDAVFFKFTTAGRLVWSKRIGDVNSDDLRGLAVHDDKLYVTGSFETKTKFATTSITSSGDSDMYVAQYDTAGNFIWAKHGGSTGVDEGWDVTVDGNGDVICTGDFKSNATFSGTQLHAMGNTDIFVAAYDDGGNLLWVKKSGGTGFDKGTGLSNDKQGNIYVTGSYEGVALFDSLHLNSFGGLDIFVLKYDPSGNPEYVKSLGGPLSERGRSCAADKYGNVFVNGEYWNYINLDTTTLTGNLLIDAFLTRIGSYPVCSATTTVTYPISCYNQCDGAAMVFPNGQGPFSYQWTTAANQTSDSVYNLCPGSYYVTITDAYGCLAIDTVNLPQPSQLVFGNTFVNGTSCLTCMDGYIDITVSGGASPYIYAWSTGSAFEDLANAGTGIYQVCVTDSLGCTACDSYQINVLGIEDIDLSKDVAISYNSSSALIEITNGAGSVFDISILNVSGQIVFEGKITEGTNRIDAGLIANGAYVVNMISKKGVVRKAFIKI
jgi:hypothetical protein